MRIAIAALIALIALFVASVASADTVIVEGGGIVRRPTVVVTSAQDHAVVLAGRGAFYHSKCSQYEGIGEGATPSEARRRCCFFGKRVIVDEGVAWSPIRRRWIAVIRYQ